MKHSRTTLGLLSAAAVLVLSACGTPALSSPSASVSSTHVSASNSAGAQPSSSPSASVHAASSVAPASDGAPSSTMNLDQIARGDFSSIQGTWNGDKNALVISGNSGEYSVTDRATLTLNGLKVHAAQGGEEHLKPTVEQSGGALHLRYSDSVQFTFYPAGVSVRDQSTGALIASEDWKDRIFYGAVSSDNATTIMSSTASMPELKTLTETRATAIEEDPARFSTVSGAQSAFISLGSTNGRPNTCYINAAVGGSQVTCMFYSATKPRNWELLGDPVYYMQVTPSGAEPKVRRYLTNSSSSKLDAFKTLVQPNAVELAPGHKITVGDITCTAISADTLECAGQMISPRGAAATPKAKS
ncbi:MAG: DUF6287 domain-containing protein [Rothia sp. (in: high G+C Gram-positive bacteria)]|uniref:DUF6287 domain-containing protein n=1 Tax=Rothia sp. (in: high G+C Gram-positive bacteria) TaxID=1885016 RepID=UPI0026E0BEC2|nr:DUF6287 domain-containing protein [Rothia sp. (in: high G+C Gram-positive bacteria)]MDO5750885.1 DUF6287 domain-containing protein [Rothia sp. (in: high G+C Gram-positive bacteria)]